MWPLRAVMVKGERRSQCLDKLPLWPLPGCLFGITMALQGERPVGLWDQVVFLCPYLRWVNQGSGTPNCGLDPIAAIGGVTGSSPHMGHKGPGLGLNSQMRHCKAGFSAEHRPQEGLLQRSQVPRCGRRCGSCPVPSQSSGTLQCRLWPNQGL